jgi:hypothetical protein
MTAQFLLPIDALAAGCSRAAEHRQYWTFWRSRCKRNLPIGEVSFLRDSVASNESEKYLPLIVVRGSSKESL